MIWMPAHHVVDRYHANGFGVPQVHVRAGVSLHDRPKQLLADPATDLAAPSRTLGRPHGGQRWAIDLCSLRWPTVRASHGIGQCLLLARIDPLCRTRFAGIQ